MFLSAKANMENKLNTVGPPTSHHPKCHAKVVAYERWSPTRA